ncbi:MAG: DNA-methyltransferase [Woeseiaceae bacterium]
MNKPEQFSADLSQYVPDVLAERQFDQRLIPAVAKDARAISAIERAIESVPTAHELICADSRRMQFLASESVHLVVTSPPYWTLKDYDKVSGQLGYVADYESFVTELDSVWKECYRALVPGGRLICVVGDVCLSRRKNGGIHEVVPLHASIQEHCRRIGFTNLAPIIWYKIANAQFEAGGSSGGFLGKPYEPNAVIKNDVEFILMERKPGGYRAPSAAKRLLSVIPERKHKSWFQQVWSGVTGASTREHPAPYPEELAERLIRMFSFVGDTVLDPFVGSGTTMVAAARWGRNSIGVEVSQQYSRHALARIDKRIQRLDSYAKLSFVDGRTPLTPREDVEACSAQGPS